MKNAIDTLGQEINEINKANGWDVIKPSGWDDPHKVPCLLALIHSEVSEALEAFRINDKENFTEELADTIIRVLDLSYGLGCDLPKAITDKLVKNRSRGYKHGGKRV